MTTGKPYAEELQNVQQNVAAKEEAHPVAGTAGSIAGNVTALAPVAEFAPAMIGLNPAASTVANVARAGAMGGTAMGLTALEQGKDPTEAATEAGVGAATFGAGPVVGKGVGALVSKLLDKTASISGPLSNQDKQALDWATTMLKSDRLMSDADIEAKFNELGPHAFLAEYGPNLTGGANAVNAMPGAGQTTVRAAITDRAAGARDRIDDAVTEALGPRVNVQNLTAQGQMDRSDAARDLYDQWRTQAIHPTDEIKALYPRLNAVGAFGEAQAKAAAEGVPFDQNFFTTGDQKAFPTAQSWDYVKRALDDKIAASKNTQTGEKTDWTRIYTGIKNDLMSAIENSNSPGAKVWAQARQAWADPTAVMRARSEGQLAFQRGTRRDDMLAQLSDYSQPERNAYKQGARDAVAEAMDNSVRGDTNARNMLLAPANQDKLQYLATNKNYNAQTLVDKLEQEKSMADFKNYVGGGSKTAATEAAKAMMTPDPTQTLTARMRAGYSPHVSPGSYLPKTLEEAAARQQGQRFEQSREAIAPWLMKQGPEAANFAKALLAHQNAVTPGVQYGPDVDRYIQMLTRGLAPGATGVASNAVYPAVRQIMQPQ